MRKKSKQVELFLTGLHNHIITDPQFRKDTGKKSEAEVQTELRPLIIDYLRHFYTGLGVKDPVSKTHKSFYWEGQEGKFGIERTPIFGSRNYPDFLITEPYLIAIEYKQSPSGSTVKSGLGQSMMHTLCNDFDFVYFLFHDESEDKRVEISSHSDPERTVISQMWNDFNVFMRFV